MKVQQLFHFPCLVHFTSSVVTFQTLPIKKLLCKYWAETHTAGRHTELFENMPKNSSPATQTSWRGFQRKSGKLTLGGKLKETQVFHLAGDTSEKGILEIILMQRFATLVWRRLTLGTC